MQLMNFATNKYIEAVAYMRVTTDSNKYIRFFLYLFSILVEFIIIDNYESYG